MSKKSVNSVLKGIKEQRESKELIDEQDFLERIAPALSALLDWVQRIRVSSKEEFPLESLKNRINKMFAPAREYKERLIAIAKEVLEREPINLVPSLIVDTWMSEMPEIFESGILEKWEGLKSRAKDIVKELEKNSEVLVDQELVPIVQDLSWEKGLNIKVKRVDRKYKINLDAKHLVGGIDPSVDV